MEVFFLLVFPLFFLGFIALIVYAIHANKKRAEALAKKASAMQLAFSRTPPTGFAEDLSAMSYFADPKNRTYSNVLYGQSGGTSVHIFEYQISQESAATPAAHTSDSLTTSHTHTSTTSTIYSAVYLRGNIALPQFLLYSSSFLDGIVKKLFGMQDIDFTTHPVFSKDCVLQGRDEAAVRKLFTPEVLTHCEKISKDTVIGDGERLVYLRRGFLMPDQIENLLREALALHQVLQNNAAKP